MAIALVTSTVKSSANLDSVTTDAIDTTGATLLVLCVADYSLVGAVTPTDSKGNTWTALTPRNSGAGGVRGKLWYAVNPTVGSGHTFTYSATGIGPAIAVAAFSGAHTTTPFDQENGAGSGASVSTLAPGSVTPSEDNELIVCGGGVEYQSGSSSIGAGMTILHDAPLVPGLAFGVTLAYKVQTSLAAINPTWTWPSSNYSSAMIATFKAAAVASGQPARKRMGGMAGNPFRARGVW